MYVLLGHRGDDGRREAPGLLKRAVRERFGLEQLPVPARGERGKPWFPDRPDIHFNLSHSGGLCLCAVGESPVGVDIELLRPRGGKLPQRALAPEEYRWYCSRGARWEDFYLLWTRKESLAKYTGRGVAEPRAVVPPLPGEEAAGPEVHSYAGEDWRAALYGGEAAPAEIRWV